MFHQLKTRLENYDNELCEKSLGIYGRDNIATALLLTYCSVLKFSFQGRVLPRGWLDVLVIGDTRCGKSTVAEGIVAGLRLGEFFKCENVSYAGLIGGLQQLGSGGRWGIVWGKIPINSGRLCVADEMSSLSLEDISNMSAVRSSGVAEINKIHTGMTRAMTRIFWISNARSSKELSEYTFGIKAIQELIGRPEDIARFDFAIGCLKSDVSQSVLNSPRTISTHDPQWAELKSLVTWVWGLRPSDVLFADKAVEAIMSSATSMSKDYMSPIPMAEPNEQRIRVARVATATAARAYSERGGKLLVEKEHVEFAEYFMRKCLDSKALNYRGYAISTQEDDIANYANASDMKEFLIAKSNGNRRPIKLLYSQDGFGPHEIEFLFNICKAESREIFSKLIQYGFLQRKSKGSWEKTKLANEILLEVLKEMENSK